MARPEVSYALGPKAHKHLGGSAGTKTGEENRPKTAIYNSSVARRGRCAPFDNFIPTESQLPGLGKLWDQGTFLSKRTTQPGEGEPKAKIRMHREQQGSAIRALQSDKVWLGSKPVS